MAAPEPAPPAPVSEPEPAPAPVVAAPSPPAPSAVSALADIAGARDFARLDPNAYTLQLSDAASPSGFPALIQALGLSADQCFLLRIKREGQAWWLLAYGQYSDANQAKAALARLPNVPGLTRTWPRKIQYLQREFDPLGP
ncbi:MAG: hypothetical protein IPK97_03885 [Ahniella sp.]|nr:hypothetical protein [Ahniella sp.]